MDHKITRLFNNSIESYKRILDFLEDFINKVKRSIIGHNPQLYEKILKILDKSNMLLMTGFASNRYEMVNNIYNQFDVIEKNISKLFSMLFTKQFIDFRNSMISPTTISLEDIERRRNIEYLQSIKDKNIENDNIIFSQFDNNFAEKEALQFILDAESNNIVFDFENDETLSEMVKETFKKKNKDIKTQPINKIKVKQTLNRFILFLLNKIIKTSNSPYNKNLGKRIIEKYKDIELGVERKNFGRLIQYPILSRVGLIPCSKFISNFDKIIEDIHKNKFNVIVLKESSIHPIEFTLDPIINEDFINKNRLFINDRAGLNETFIKKSLTINELNNDKENKEWSIEYYLKGDNEDYPFIIIEVMNGYYRFLKKTNVVDSPDLSNLSKLSEIAIDKKDIVSLFNGSIRPSKYNLLAYVNPFKKEMNDVIDKYNSRAEITYSTEPIKLSLLNDIVNILNVPISSIRDFRRMRIDENKIVIAVSRAFAGDIKEIKDKSANQYAEMFMNNYMNIFHIANFIVKKLRKLLHTIPINENVFKEYNREDIAIYFRKIAEDTVKGMLENMDTLRMFKKNTSLMMYMMSNDDII